MNPATHRSLMAVAAQEARNYPADVRRPLAQGVARYRNRLRAIHGAVLVLAVLLLGAGLLTMQGADSTGEDAPSVIEPTPKEPPPVTPLPDDPTLVRIDLDPPSLTMIPEESLRVQAIGTFEDGSEEPIPASGLSWDVNSVEEQLEIPDVASVDSATGTVTANRPGRATLTASTHGTADPKGTTDITVTDASRARPDFPGPTDLQNPNSTTSPDSAVR